MSNSNSPRIIFAAFALTASSALAPTALAQNALENAKVVAADGAASDTFGRAVSISGVRAVVGSPLDNHLGKTSGSAYVFERQNDAWVQVAKLAPFDATNGDVFGTSVSISGDRLVIGAEGDDDGGSSSGSAYVYMRNATGGWVFEAKLVAQDAAIYDEFGSAVTIDGTRVLVGAKGEDDGGSGAGAAYVFERQTSGAWIQTAKLLSNAPSVGDQFGHALSVSGDRAVIGSHLDDDAAVDAGAAYVFRRNSNGTWTQEAKLIHSNATNFDYGAFAVDIDGSRVVTGAYRYDAGGNDTGAAFVFERQSSGAWVQKGVLLASDRAPDDRFGEAVSISGDWVLSGAHGNAHAGFESGAAYLFGRQTNETWGQTSKFVASDAASVDQFGRYVALDNGRAMVGAFLDDDKGSGSGSAYALDVGALMYTKGTVSLAGNGTQQLNLRAGSAWAGSPYYFLGSASGSGSGIPLGAGVMLPLVYDGYMQWGLAKGLPISGGSGLLDGSGSATATFRVVPGTSTSFIGMQFTHAFVAYNMSTGQQMSSNAVSVRIVP